MSRKLLSVVLCAVPFLAACGASVQRVSLDKDVNLSEKLNDSDASIAAKDIVNQCLNAPWLQRATAGGQTPVVKLGGIYFSDTKMHARPFLKMLQNDLSDALINDGRVDFVASDEESGALRAEVEEQQTYSSKDTRKEMNQEIGTDYSLVGKITAVDDSSEGVSRKTTIVTYQIEMLLENVQTHKIVWKGSTKIRKMMKQSGFGL